MSRAVSRSPRAGPSPRRGVLAFVGRFSLGWAAALALAAFVPGIERGMIAATVAAVAGVLQAASLHPAVTGTSILVGSSPIEITPDCTSLMPTAALWVAMLAFPAPAPWKLAGGLAGAAALWLYNLGRILAMVGVLNTRPGWFEFLHVWLWQTMTLVAVIGLFLLWLRLEPRRARGG